MKADGTKFGKSESGTVWLDPARTSPYQLYQFFVRSDDAVVGTYLRYFTFLSHGELEELDASTAEHPERREAQRQLARQVCTLVHGEAETLGAERAAAALFGEEVAGSTSDRSSTCSPMRPRSGWLDRGSTVRAWRWSTSSSRPGCLRKARRGPSSARVGPTSTTGGRPMSIGVWAPEIWWPAAIWSSGAGSRTTT